MPTASGKTWVQALIAMHYLNKGMKVSIIEPNENLRTQTMDLLENLGFDFDVRTI